MPTEKDHETELLRSLVLASKDVVETDIADCGLTTLSFQSVRFPYLNIWVDTDLAGELKIDLEDWRNDETWDNSVAHLTAPNRETCIRIIIAWLTGHPIDACRQLGGQDVDVR